MKGLELSEAFFREYGMPMLEKEFSRLLPQLAAGLCGGGSECFGYDDEVSRDHDFEAGFCLFLPDEDTVSRRDAFLLERAYEKLPKTYMGFRRASLSPVGGNRHGVIRISDFFRDKVGCPTGELTLSDWLTLPEQSLSEATNGKLFFDNLGQITGIREKLAVMPDDPRKKRLAGHLLLAAQAGQYNYARCLARNDTGAAQLCAVTFAEHAMNAAFLSENVYMPYYKWRFRAFRSLPFFSAFSDGFEYLISSDNAPASARQKTEIIGRVSDALCRRILEKGLCRQDASGNAVDPGSLAYAVNDAVTDEWLRNLSIYAAV